MSQKKILGKEERTCSERQDWLWIEFDCWNDYLRSLIKLLTPIATGSIQLTRFCGKLNRISRESYRESYRESCRESLRLCWIQTHGANIHGSHLSSGLFSMWNATEMSCTTRWITIRPDWARRWSCWPTSDPTCRSIWSRRGRQWCPGTETSISGCLSSASGSAPLGPSSCTWPAELYR